MRNKPPLIRTAKSTCIGLHHNWVEGSSWNTECHSAFKSSSTKVNGTWRVALSRSKFCWNVTRYSSHQNNCCVDTFPTQQAEKAREQHANASLTRTPHNPPHHPARSNMHHLQQPHKKPTPQSRSYWFTYHSTHKFSLHATNIIQIRNKNHTDEAIH